jgi:hypothetical protein
MRLVLVKRDCHPSGMGHAAQDQHPGAFAKTQEQQQILKLIFARQVMGRPYLAPPDLPKERAAALQQAFTDTMKDPDFLAAAKQEKLEINPVSGAEIEKLLQEAYQTPAPIAAKAGSLANGGRTAKGTN